MLSNLLNFLDEAKTKFEAIRITKDILIKNGFVEVKEADSYIKKVFNIYDKK